MTKKKKLQDDLQPLEPIAEVGPIEAPTLERKLLTVLGPVDAVVYVTAPPTRFEGGKAELPEAAALALVNDRAGGGKFHLL